MVALLDFHRYDSFTGERVHGAPYTRILEVYSQVSFYPFLHCVLSTDDHCEVEIFKLMRLWMGVKNQGLSQRFNIHYVFFGFTKHFILGS